MVSKRYKNDETINISIQTFTYIYLYQSLIRPILSPGSQICSPYYQEHIKEKLEAVQHRFLRYLSDESGKRWIHFKHDFTSRARKCNIESIK